MKKSLITIESKLLKPMLKYRGGKSKDIPFFEKYIPSEFDTYYEPFIGGGAVFFYIQPHKAVINDINPGLMGFYTDVRNNYAEVRKQLDYLQELYEINQKQYVSLKKDNPNSRVENKNEALYYSLRDMFNHKLPSCYLNSVLYYFINKTAYSGMIRYNAQGDYNVPFGRYQNFNTKLVTEEHSRILQSATLLNEDYSTVFEMVSENDFMFLDPPYDCIFNDYGNLELSNGFNEIEHRRLAAAYKKLNCKALMIIGKTDLTVELYGDFIKDEYDKTYAVNIRNRFKSEAKHIVVTNY